MTKILCSKSTKKIGFRGSLPHSWGWCPQGGKVTLLQCLGKGGYEKQVNKPEFGNLEDHEPCKFCLGVIDTLGIKELKAPKDERWVAQKTIKIPVEDLAEKADKKDLDWLKEENENLREQLKKKEL